MIRKPNRPTHAAHSDDRASGLLQHILDGSVVQVRPVAEFLKSGERCFFDVALDKRRHRSGSCLHVERPEVRVLMNDGSLHFVVQEFRQIVVAVEQDDDFFEMAQRHHFLL